MYSICRRQHTFWLCTMTFWPTVRCTMFWMVVSCRCHESVDRGLLKNLLRMLVDLQLYQDIFEMEFLTETETMYHAESLKMLRDPEFTVRSCCHRCLFVYFFVCLFVVVWLTSYPTTWGMLRKDWLKKTTEFSTIFTRWHGKGSPHMLTALYPHAAYVGNLWSCV